MTNSPPIQLSVVIVNYNVAFFLEQCLYAVRAALRDVEGEVLVVDNHSIDSSVAMVRSKFPEVHLIANAENVGFSKANNQALKRARGRYHLLLNPDTIVAEDTFLKVIDFMDSHPQAGGLGVKMIDGTGRFLPESKRGLPTPKDAFYKIFGLSRLFPRSKRFARYHLSFLDKDRVQEVEILSGAFMLLRKTALDKVGLLDEAFFMYGEDIDLSYRILLGGYKNYYYPETQIVHYKGESTKKSSVNYVFVFYNAMLIFSKKHFSEKKAKLYAFLIHLAIYFRASVALFNRLAQKTVLPLLDAALLVAGLFLIAHYYQAITQTVFTASLLSWALPVYGVVWLLAQVFSGGYDLPIRLRKHAVGAVVGTGIILAGYALLPKTLQFSRLIILLGGVWTLLYYSISRCLLHSTIGKTYRIGGVKNKHFAIVGYPAEAERVAHILRQTYPKIQSIQFLSPADAVAHSNYVGTLSQLEQLLDVSPIDEVIFCAKEVPATQIIAAMLSLERHPVHFKVSLPEAPFLIGSNTIATQGDLYAMDISRINRLASKRNKRLMDIGLSLVLLLLTPCTIWLYRNKRKLCSNLARVLVGSRSWVGYEEVRPLAADQQLPRIRKGVLSLSMMTQRAAMDEETISRINLIYAKNYTLQMDLSIVWKYFRKLDS